MDSVCVVQVELSSGEAINRRAPALSKSFKNLNTQVFNSSQSTQSTMAFYYGSYGYPAYGYGLGLGYGYGLGYYY